MTASGRKRPIVDIKRVNRTSIYGGHQVFGTDEISQIVYIFKTMLFEFFHCNMTAGATIAENQRSLTSEFISVFIQIFEWQVDGTFDTFVGELFK